MRLRREMPTALAMRLRRGRLRGCPPRAGANAAARRQMQLRRQDAGFRPCMTSQGRGAEPSLGEPCRPPRSPPSISGVCSAGLRGRKYGLSCPDLLSLASLPAQPLHPPGRALGMAVPVVIKGREWDTALLLVVGVDVLDLRCPRSELRRRKMPTALAIRLRRGRLRGYPPRAGANAAARRQMRLRRCRARLPTSRWGRGAYRHAPLHTRAPPRSPPSISGVCSAGLRGRHNVPSMAHSGFRQRPVASTPTPGWPYVGHGRAGGDRGVGWGMRSRC